jgi:hypothetical protein
VLLLLLLLQLQLQLQLAVLLLDVLLLAAQPQSNLPVAEASGQQPAGAALSARLLRAPRRVRCARADRSTSNENCIRAGWEQ